MFFEKSHVPSPTVNVLDEYELEPGGARASAGAMAAVGCPRQAKPVLKNTVGSRRECGVSEGRAVGMLMFCDNWQTVGELREYDNAGRKANRAGRQLGPPANAQSSLQL